jgi:hypothetical protein
VKDLKILRVAIYSKRSLPPKRRISANANKTQLVQFLHQVFYMDEFLTTENVGLLAELQLELQIRNQGGVGNAPGTAAPLAPYYPRYIPPPAAGTAPLPCSNSTNNSNINSNINSSRKRPAHQITAPVPIMPYMGMPAHPNSIFPMGLHPEELMHHLGSIMAQQYKGTTRNGQSRPSMQPTASVAAGFNQAQQQQQHNRNISIATSQQQQRHRQQQHNRNLPIPTSQQQQQQQQRQLQQQRQQQQQQQEHNRNLPLPTLHNNGASTNTNVKRERQRARSASSTTTASVAAAAPTNNAAASTSATSPDNNNAAPPNDNPLVPSEQETPLTPQECHLMSQLVQMGFQDRAQMVRGIRQSNGSSAEAVMMWIVKQTEDAEEAQKIDEGRRRSEALRAENALKQKQAEEERLEAATTREDLQTIFGAASWILKFLTQELLEKVVLVSRHKACLVRLLKIESMARKWYKSKLPSYYFKDLCRRIDGRKDETGDALVQWLMNECDTLESGLYKLEEQQGGVPKLFLRAQEDHPDEDDDEEDEEDDEVEVIGIRVQEHQERDLSTITVPSANPHILQQPSPRSTTVHSPATDIIELE